MPIVRRSLVVAVASAISACSLLLAAKNGLDSQPIAPSQSTSTASDAAAAKRADIRKLLELTGTDDLMRSQVETVIAQFKQSAPQIDSEFWDEFRKEIRFNELIEMTVDCYDRNLSAEDIHAMVVFYETPSGQRIATALPQVMRESTEAGMKWGTELGERVAKTLRERAATQSPKHDHPHAH